MTSNGLRYYSLSDYLSRSLWALAQPFWRYSPRWCWAWRRSLLRLFGACIGSDVRIYPAARIHQPWNLVIGTRCTVAWNVTLYCLGSVIVGADVVISQGAHLCAGDHAIRDPEFSLLKHSIHVGNGAWIAAEAFIGPSVTIGERAVVGARAVVMRDVSPDAVVAGNPARVVGER